MTKRFNPQEKSRETLPALSPPLSIFHLKDPSAQMLTPSHGATSMTLQAFSSSNSGSDAHIGVRRNPKNPDTKTNGPWHPGVCSADPMASIQIAKEQPLPAKNSASPQINQP